MTEQKKGWFQRLTDGLSRSSKQMTEGLVGGLVKQPLDQAKLDQLEETLYLPQRGYSKNMTLVLFALPKKNQKR